MSGSEPIEQQIRKEAALQLRTKAEDYAEQGLLHLAESTRRLSAHVESGGTIDAQQEFNAKFALTKKNAQPTGED